MPNFVRGGISVEDPCLFPSGGRWYYFTAMISNPAADIGAQNFDNKHLELFEYTNEINSLCLYGNIVYTDIDGSISKFFNRVDNHVQVMVQQVEKVQAAGEGGSSGDSGIEMFVPIGRPGKNDYFIHTFIVQNIKVLKRDGQVVTYQLSLISTLWYALCSTIEFSNYPEDSEETDKNPKNGYKLLKHFLSQDLHNSRPEIIVDAKSFDDAAAKSKIKIPFITNNNDNIFTIMPYVFNRLYWRGDQMDESMKFIVFDPISWTYKCIDYSDTTTWLTCEKPNIIMSMFETDYEQSLFSANNQLASMVGRTMTKAYEDLFEHKIWTFDSKIGSLGFTHYKASLKTDEIATLYNSRPDVFEGSMNLKKIKDKYPLELNPMAFANANTYDLQTAIWNNDFSMYQNMLDNLTKRDAWVINTEGDVTHQPGTCMAVILDRTIDKVPELTPEQRDDLYKKHAQLEAMFPVLKVQHRYHLATKSGESVDPDASYTENVVLGRNFVLDLTDAVPPRSVDGATTQTQTTTVAKAKSEIRKAVNETWSKYVDEAKDSIKSYAKDIIGALL